MENHRLSTNGKHSEETGNERTEPRRVVLGTERRPVNVSVS